MEVSTSINVYSSDFDRSPREGPMASLISASVEARPCTPSPSSTAGVLRPKATTTTASSSALGSLANVKRGLHGTWRKEPLSRYGRALRLYCHRDCNPAVAAAVLDSRRDSLAQTAACAGTRWGGDADGRALGGVTARVHCRRRHTRRFGSSTPHAGAGADAGVEDGDEAVAPPVSAGVSIDRRVTPRRYILNPKVQPLNLSP